MIRNLTSHRPLLVALACSAAAVGCASKSSTSSDPSTELASSGDDGASTEASMEAMSTSFVGSSNGSLAIQSFRELSPGSGDLHALGTLSNPAGGFFQPAGCVTGTSDPATNTVTYVFNNCTGPWGLWHYNGTVTVVWSVVSPTELKLQYSAQNFKVNNATITTWTATADATDLGNNQRKLVWTAQLQGTTGGGRAFQRTNNKTFTWTVGQPCIGIEGSSDGTITGKNLEIDFTSFQVCAGQCPASGSEITIKDLDNGEQVSVKWLGGSQAQFTGVNGNTITYTPLCAL